MMPTGLKNIISKPKLLIPTIVVAIGVILGVVVVAVRSDKPAQAAPRPLDVEVIRVEQKDVPVYSEWIGTTEGIVNADIKAEVTGYLLKQDYKEGSFVKKGQLLFELDPRPFQAAVDQANAQVEAARAGVETARAQLRAATAQIGTAKAAINTAKGQIENAQAAVRTAQLNLGFTRIISPIDGIAGIAQAQVGNLITTTSAPLTTVSTVDPIKVYFTLSEQQ